MENSTKEVLEAINSRFPKGRHCARINLMLNEEIDFDYQEVIDLLNEIINHGGSDKNYITQDDKTDAAFFITQLSKYSN
jgi:hypothetical protein